MKRQNFVFVIAIIAASALLANGQYPQRLNIPGAVPAQRSQQPVRVRRPIALRSQGPAPQSRIVHDDKPVTESEEDEQPDVFLPQLLREQQLAQAQQAQFHQAASAFLNEPNGIIQEQPQIQVLQHIDTQPASILPAPTRLPERPLPSHTPSGSRLPFNDFGIGRFENTPRFGQERPAPAKSAPLLPQEPLQLPQPIHRVSNSRPRPAPRPEARPHYEAQEAPVRPRPKPAPPRPVHNQNQLQDSEVQRPKRPVAQTTRKWREENEDGSITWGYENDDGSFKEEIIGTDCVTKGTYGYIDPDGNKREYHYETGNKCDPNAREAEEEELDENGYVNYDDNKAVLPNGLEIDMSQLGRKKSKRPGSVYRN